MDGKNEKKPSLPERVAQLYYSHALFCSSHPILLIILSLSCFLSCCYPLLNIPMPGSTPTHIVLPCAPCDSASDDNLGSSLCSTLCISTQPANEVEDNYQQPLLYIHQLILNTGVWPWNESLRAEDAYRAPLQEAFRLLDIIRNHQDPVTGASLGHICYHVESVSSKRKWVNSYSPSQERNGNTEIFPEYNCLVLSPANLWHQDVDKFSLDPDPLETIFAHQSLQKGKISTAEMVFGMHLKETGIKRYPLRARTRMVQYAVTLFYNNLNVGYMKSLNEKLLASYPDTKVPSVTDTEATLIYYPADFNYYEFVPLCVAFVGLFIYIYFSVRKIEFIKSKVGLAIAAVVSIAAGLAMSIGICFFFGLTLSFRGKEIFPYLVILVGLENVFVLTKSVMSIDSQLDVKIRLAQGLSKEGWSITKNILTEITILTLCLFTFIPVIQQFSIFMIVTLLSDFFLQMFFFTTVLGIDIKRKELSRERPSAFHFYGLNKLSQQDCTKYHGKASYDYNPPIGKGSKVLPRSKSQPRLNGYCPCPMYMSSSMQRLTHGVDHKSKGDANGRVPKRIRLVNVWARTRFFQRAFMIWMVVWVSMIIYTSGVVDGIFALHHNESMTEKSWKVDAGHSPTVHRHHGCNASLSECSGILNARPSSGPPPRHWAALLAHYNVSCAGRHLAVAPSLILRHRVSPEIAIAARPPPPLHPDPPLRWRAFAAALDPLDFSDMEKEEGRWMWKHPGDGEDQPFYPTSLMELFLLALLCCISVLFISYMMVVLYRCVCTRNYAEWRATWTRGGADGSAANHTPQIVMEVIPVVVPGHSQEVECLATDGERVVSSCLQGTIKVWDPITGEMLTSINRTMFFELQNEVMSKLQSEGKDNNSELETCVHEDISRPKVAEGLKLANQFKFSSSGASSASQDSYLLSSITRKSKTIYDFTLQYRRMMQSSADECRRDGAEGPSSRKSSMCEAEPSESERTETYTAIWCLSVCRCWDVIVVGCANGRLEFWSASSGRLECMSENAGANGITHLQTVGELVVLARLSGHLEMLRLHMAIPILTSSSTAPPSNTRGHVRTGSAGSIPSRDTPSHLYNRFAQKSEAKPSCVDVDQEALQCHRVNGVRAHQQPLTALECDTRWVVSGSSDHTVKVFWLDDFSLIYVFHGHRGPVASLFLDGESSVCGSGSQEGLMCVWDPVTGACVYSVVAHDGPVTALTFTASYVISLGGDDKMCIWDRFRGHLLNTVSLGGGAGGCGLLSLGPSLVVSGGRGGLTLWDACTATALRKVHLGHQDGCTFIKQILPLRDGIVCDYSNQLRIVRFPSISNNISKCD